MGCFNGSSRKCVVSGAYLLDLQTFILKTGQPKARSRSIKRIQVSDAIKGTTLLRPMGYEGQAKSAFKMGFKCLHPMQSPSTADNEPFLFPHSHFSFLFRKIQLDVQLAKLCLGHLTRCIHHQILSLLIHRESNDFANVGLIC